MFISNWKKEIFTLPNLLSLLRLGLIPVYCALYLGAQTKREYLAAGAVLALSCLTDALDGYIARRFRMISTVGKVLDPLADKATQIAVLGCLALRYPVLKALLVLLVLKECCQALAVIFSLGRGSTPEGALPAGKISTAVLFVSLTALVIFPELKAGAVRTVALVDGLFLLVSFFSYLGACLKTGEKG